MTIEQIQKRIAELRAAKPLLQAEVDRQLNYQFGVIDGQILALEGFLAGMAGGEQAAPDAPGANEVEAEIASVNGKEPSYANAT